jgi:hypothetical protein
VHEIVSGLLTVQRPAQARRIVDVGVHRSPGAAVLVGMAGQRRYLVAVIRQPFGDGGPDEPGRPRDGDPHREQSRLGTGAVGLDTNRHVPSRPAGEPRRFMAGVYELLVWVS